MGARAERGRLTPAAVGGLLLLTAAVVAFVWANSPLAGSYLALWQVDITLGAGALALSKPLILWVNDGLMALFFLLVGLEIKRELLTGTLSSPRRAALPLMAALGGVLLPAGIYAIVNMSDGGVSRGWPIPAATDIAFALGILALLGSRVPIGLKVFLTAVAVVDDLVAVLIIATVLTDGVVMAALGFAAVAILGLAGLNRTKVSHPLPYILLGGLLWLAVLKSGVHATIAGVALSLFIPAGRSLSGGAFLDRLGDALKRARGQEESGELAPRSTVHALRTLCNDAESPLLRWEHALQPWVMFGVMPVFALANAGVALGSAGGASLLDPVPLGVLLGLLLGKPVGIMLFSWFAVRTRVASLPEGVSWRQLHGAAWLAGIGFTMSLFVAGLALEGTALAAAKLGLLLGSAAAGIVGTLLLRAACPRPATAPQPLEAIGLASGGSS